LFQPEGTLSAELYQTTKQHVWVYVGSTALSSALRFGFITPVATQRNYFSKLVELADDVADRLVFSKQFVFDRKAFTLIALLALRLDLYKNSIS
jgi:hypothetical protein